MNNKRKRKKKEVQTESTTLRMDLSFRSIGSG
jgi:hypothetical protein